MYVIDSDGYLIADTASIYSEKASTGRSEDYFPRVENISSSKAFENLLIRMRAKGNGVGAYKQDGAIQNVVFRNLTAFNWTLVFDVPQARMMSRGEFSVNRLKTVVAILTTLVILGTLISIFIISKRITEPIIQLGNATKKIRDGSLDTKIAVEGDDEIHDLAESFNAMAGSLKKTIELEKRLAISEQALKHEKLAAIGSLSARIVHDIRNALATIKTTVDMLRRDGRDLDAVTTERYAKVNRGVELMVRQVNSVLNFVRSRPPQYGRHSLLEIINAAFENVPIPETITVKLPESDLEVRCDRNRIESMFGNLLVNAAQAIGEKGQIQVRLREEADKVVVEVEDSGPGIPEELLPSVFDLVFTTKEHGTGLGLFSCKASVEQHGGRISAYNYPTRFVIELPRDRASSSAHRHREQMARRHQAAAETSSSTEARSLACGRKASS